MILGQRRRKRGQGEGRREERELMRAKRRREEEKRPSEAVTNKEQLAAVSNIVCFVLRIVWEAPETSNALASAECARSLIKDPADDRRLCERGGGGFLCVWALRRVSSRGGRGEKGEKKRKKEKQGESDKEGILFKRIIGCRENKDFLPLRFAYFALNFWLSGIFCEVGGREEEKKNWSEKLFLPTLFASFPYILGTLINPARWMEHFLYLLDSFNTSFFFGREPKGSVSREKEQSDYR